MHKDDERRLQENEVIFKQVNKDVEEFLHDIGVQNQVAVPFYCECSDLGCRMRLELTPAEYEKIHKNKRRFIVVNGHEVPQIENVVERNENYSVVEKLDKPPQPHEVQRRLKEL